MRGWMSQTHSSGVTRRSLSLFLYQMSVTYHLLTFVKSGISKGVRNEAKVNRCTVG